MKINTNREVEIFDQAYRLGFQAGQLDWWRHTIEGHQRVGAEMAGHRIAVIRGNISPAEYVRYEGESQEEG